MATETFTFSPPNSTYYGSATINDFNMNWPPVGNVGYGSGLNPLVQSRRYEFSARTVGLIWYDTSSMLRPSDYIIDAKLGLRADTIYLADSLTLGIGYYPGTAYPIDASDYALVDETSAATYPLMSIPFRQVFYISLSSPNVYINKTGLTGFRLTINPWSFVPTSINQVVFDVFQLVVTVRRPLTMVV